MGMALIGTLFRQFGNKRFIYNNQLFRALLACIYTVIQQKNNKFFYSPVTDMPRIHVLYAYTSPQTRQAELLDTDFAELIIARQHANLHAMAMGIAAR